MTIFFRTYLLIWFMYEKLHLMINCRRRHPMGWKDGIGPIEMVVCQLAVFCSWHSNTTTWLLVSETLGSFKLDFYVYFRLKYLTVSLYWKPIISRFESAKIRLDLIVRLGKVKELICWRWKVSVSVILRCACYPTLFSYGIFYQIGTKCFFLAGKQGFWFPATIVLLC